MGDLFASIVLVSKKRSSLERLLIRRRTRLQITSDKIT